MLDDTADATTLHTGRLVPDDIWGILTVYAEARGEPYEGKVAVGNVIRHRTARKFFSNGTVASTVWTPYQFSWTNQGDAQRVRVVSAEWEDDGMKECARAWFESEVHEIVPDATHYYAEYVAPYWSKANGMIRVAQIGRHIFLREQVNA